MATTNLKSEPVNTVGDLPKVGDKAPDFTLTGSDLGEVSLKDFAGKTVVLNIFPSLETGVCANSVRNFDQKSADVDNAVVLNVSMDLPFSQDRFANENDVKNAKMGSAFRSDFGTTYGVELAESPMAGLFARTVIVVNPEGVIDYVQLVDEITTEPDYDAALKALA